jgi:hypothetical protein
MFLRTILCQRRAGIRVRTARAGSPGFTLIETALATVIVGVGVLALLDAQAAFHLSNDWSTHAATGTYLANEVRELTRKFPKHDPVTGLYFVTQGQNQVLRGWGPEAGESTVGDLNDLDDFDGLTFSNSGTAILTDGNLTGPIDAFGNVIPDILTNGTVRLDANGQPMPLQGWSQSITVEKLDPYNTAVVRAHSYVLPPVPPNFAGLAVDQFPLRVTVTVRYQGPDDSSPQDVARVVWIAP